jgi:hypothetical protein
MGTRARHPWWLDDGTESCCGCTHTHAYEMEFRCVACDRGICCHCVRIVMQTRELLCPECEAESVEA